MIRIRARRRARQISGKSFSEIDILSGMESMQVDMYLDAGIMQYFLLINSGNLPMTHLIQ